MVYVIQIIKIIIKIMKKILGILGIFIFSLINFTSCEKPYPPVPDCEKYGYGDIIVKNYTGYSAWVDVTYDFNSINYEKFLYDNSSFRYEMDNGLVYIWISFDGDDWFYDTYYLSSCEELTYTWYFNKKKSTSTDWWNDLQIIYTNNNGKIVNKNEVTHYGKRN